MPFKEQVYVALLVAQGRIPAEAYDPCYDETYDTLIAWADREGILTIDLRGPLRAAAQQGLRLYWRRDGHLTPAGHAAVARALRGRLQFPLDQRERGVVH